MSRVVRLGEVCEIRIGRTPSRANPSYWNGSHPWATISDLSGDTVTTTREGITDAAIQELRLRPVEAGTLLYSFKLTIGKMAVAGNDMFTNEAIAALVPRNRTALDRDYLRYALRSIDPLKDSSVAVKGRTLNSATLAEIKIPVPPIEAQRRVDARLTETLSAVARARAAASDRRKIVDRLIEAELSRALSSRAGWHGVALHDVVEIQLGKMLSPASRTGRRPIPYIRNANVQWDRVDLTDVAEMDFDEREEAKFGLRPGDVLVCEGGEPGRAAVWRGEITRCCYQKALHRLRPLNDAVDPEFLVFTFWLAALRGEFTEDHAKTTIAHLPAVRLSELRVSLPSLSTQRRLALQIRRRLDAIRHLQREIQGQVDTIDILPAAILREAFEGFAA